MIDYIKGANLRRGYDYVKIHKGEEDEYTPVMTIMCDTAMGRSFMITLDALWKYDEPKENRDAALMQQDMQEFQAICDRVIFHERAASSSRRASSSSFRARAVSFERVSSSSPFTRSVSRVSRPPDPFPSDSSFANSASLPVRAASRASASRSRLATSSAFASTASWRLLSAVRSRFTSARRA